VTEKKELLKEKEQAKEIVTLKKKIAKLERDLQSSQWDYRESKKQFESLFELTNDAIIIMDLDGNYLMANMIASDLFGFKQSEVTSLTAFDFIVPEEQPDSYNRLQEIKQGEILPIYERTLRKKSGEIFTAEMNLSIVRDENGKGLYIQSIIRDISERKHLLSTLLRDRTVFHDLALRVLETKDVKEFCNYALEYLIKSLNFDFGTLRIQGEDKSIYEPLAIYGMKKSLEEQIQSVKSTDTKLIVSLLLKTKKPIFAPDATKSKTLKRYNDRLEKFNIKSLMAWPLSDSQNNIIGLIQLSSNKVKDFTDEDKLLFESISKLLAVALEKYITERELASIFEEQKELFKIINLSPAIVFLWRNESNWPVEFVSENVSILGYTVDDFISGNVNYRELIHPDDLRIEGSDGDLFKKDYPYTYPVEYRIKNNENEERWILEYSIPRKNEEDKITHYHGLIFDITDRKMNEQSLIRERKALSIIAQEAVKTNEINLFCQSIIAELASTLDFDVGTIRLYDSADKSLHLVAEYNLKGAFGELPKALPLDSEKAMLSIVARNKVPIFSPTLAHPSLNKEILTRMMSLGVKAHITYPLLNSENNLMGVIQLVSNKNIYLRDSDKIFFESMHKLLATAIERMLTQNELIESESQFRTTVDTMSDGITIIHNNEVMYANDRACEIFGYPREEFMKVRTFIMIAPEDRERYLNDLQEMVAACKSFNELEYWIIQKNGNRRYINNRHHVIYNEVGKAIDIFILTSDITEKKIAEENLKKLNEELEQRVIERTVQLALANDDLESFSYSVSHDLRTPLRSIDGFSQALQEDYSDQVDATGKDYLHRIRNATKRMSNLIDDILDLSRLTRKKVNTEDVNLSDLANEIVKEFKTNEPDRSININIEKNLIVKADSTLLRTVMENLIGNAWKFTSKKEGAIIEIGSTFLNNETTYYVKDNGVGFDKTYADKLFTVFQRLHSTSDFTGTGIGLAVVQKVITKHNGKIWAESEVNQGATFYFTLHTEIIDIEEK